MLHNQLVRRIMKHTMSDSTAINIESHIRIDTTTKEVRNYFYRRVMEGANENVVITIDEPVVAE